MLVWLVLSHPELPPKDKFLGERTVSKSRQVFDRWLPHCPPERVFQSGAPGAPSRVPQAHWWKCAVPASAPPPWCCPPPIANPGTPGGKVELLETKQEEAASSFFPRAFWTLYVFADLNFFYLKKVQSAIMLVLNHIRLFATPWTVAHQAPLSMEFSRQKYWNGWPFPSPRGLPHPGIEPGSPALQADSLLSEPPGKPSVSNRGNIKLFFLCQRHWVNIFEASKQILNLTSKVSLSFGAVACELHFRSCWLPFHNSLWQTA